jgi:hypothetical protein
VFQKGVESFDNLNIRSLNTNSFFLLQVIRYRDKICLPYSRIMSWLAVTIKYKVVITLADLKLSVTRDSPSGHVSGQVRLLSPAPFTTTVWTDSDGILICIS